MIVTLLLTIVFGILNAVFSLIPSFSLEYLDGPRAIDGGLFITPLELAQSLVMFNLFMPVDVIVGGIGVILAAFVFAATVQFFRWVWSVIPGKGT